MKTVEIEGKNLKGIEIEREGTWKNVAKAWKVKQTTIVLNRIFLNVVLNQKELVAKTLHFQFQLNKYLTNPFLRQHSSLEPYKLPYF